MGCLILIADSRECHGSEYDRGHDVVKEGQFTVFIRYTLNVPCISPTILVQRQNLSAPGIFSASASPYRFPLASASAIFSSISGLVKILTASLLPT